MTFKTPYLLGPDTSNVNGRYLDVGKAKKQDCDFAIFKASEGTGFVDKLLAGNVQRAQSAGLLVAAYHFLHHGSPKTEARHYVDCLRRAGIAPDKIGHCVDVEKLGGSRAECTKADVDIYVGELRRLLGGIPVGVYSYYYYWHTLMGNPRLPGNTWAWAAIYVQPPRYRAPNDICQRGGSDHVGVTPGYWVAWGGTRDYGLRQFTSKASCGGIRPCDVSVFSGSRDELAALWGVGSDKLAPAHHTPHHHDDPGDIMAKLPLVKRGDNNRHVRDVQGLCNSHWEHITIDGDFGPATEAAVKTVQRRYKVAADGVVGPVTWTCLLRVT